MSGAWLLRQLYLHRERQHAGVLHNTGAQGPRPSPHRATRRAHRSAGCTLTRLFRILRWNLDAVSAVSLALVVALLQASPAPASLAWGGLELFFFTWYTLVRLPRLDSIGSPACGQALHKGQELFQRLIDEKEGAVTLLQRYPHHLHNWFVGQAGRLGVNHVADLLDYLLLQGHGKNKSDCEDCQAKLQQMASFLWNQLGLDRLSSAGAHHQDEAQQQQQSADAQPLSASHHPLMACYRPLLFYMLTEAVAAWSHLALTLRQGFKHVSSTPTASYYMKQGWRTNRPPLVFMHGIGVGLAPYHAFLNRLAARTGRTVIAIQFKHVSMRMTHHVPSVKQVADDIQAFLSQQGVTKAGFVAHSYGTMVASTIVKHNPSLVTELTLLDPVCFAMFLPHLIRASLFFHLSKASPRSSVDGAESAEEEVEQDKAPKRRWALRSMLKGVVVRDVHVAAALSRNAHWSEANLWLNDLPRNVPTRVVVSGSDHLLPVEELTCMLTSRAAQDKGVQLRVFPGRGHGAFVLDPFMQDNILEFMGDLVTGPVSHPLKSPLPLLSAPPGASELAGVDLGAGWGMPATSGPQQQPGREEWLDRHALATVLRFMAVPVRRRGYKLWKQTVGAQQASQLGGVDAAFASQAGYELQPARVDVMVARAGGSRWDGAHRPRWGVPGQRLLHQGVVNVARRASRVVKSARHLLRTPRAGPPA